MRFEQYRAALSAFFTRRAAEIERNIHTYADHRFLWMARKAELELVRRFAQDLPPKKGAPKMTKLKLWLAGAWRSRTMWAALVLVMVGIAQMFSGGLSWLTPTSYGAFLTAVGVAVAALRSITSTSIIGKVPGTGPAPNPTMGPPKS